MGLPVMVLFQADSVGNDMLTAHLTIGEEADD